MPTPILDKLFAGLAASSGYGSSGFITNLTQNNIYTMFNTIRTSPTYRTNVMGANGLGAANGLPLNFFVANPWAASANYVQQRRLVEYNGLEVEVKRQFGNGFFLLANYTFSKVLADTTFGESQTEAQNYQSLKQHQPRQVRVGNQRAAFLRTDHFLSAPGRPRQEVGFEYEPAARLCRRRLDPERLHALVHGRADHHLLEPPHQRIGHRGDAGAHEHDVQQLQNNIGVYQHRHTAFTSSTRPRAVHHQGNHKHRELLHRRARPRLALRSRRPAVTGTCPTTDSRAALLRSGSFLSRTSSFSSA